MRSQRSKAAAVQPLYVLFCVLFLCAHIAGRRGASVRTIGLEALTACFQDINTLVDAFTQHGEVACRRVVLLTQVLH